MEASERNPKGYFEDIDVYNFNESKLLPYLGRQWHSIGFIDWSAISISQRSKLELEALEILNNNYPHSNSLSVLKEPRLSILLPFWISVCNRAGFNIKVVCVLRNPLSVARSLSKGEGLSLSHAGMLYVSYWLSILSSIPDLPMAFVEYDDILGDASNQLRRIASSLAIPMPADIEERLANFSASFIDLKLRHTEFAINELDLEPDLPAPAVSLYKELLKLYQEENIKTSRDFLHSIEPLMASLQPIFLEFDTMIIKLRDSKTNIENLHKALEQRDAQIEGLNQAVGQRDVQIEGLHQAVGQRDVQIEGLQQAVGQRDVQIEGLQQAVGQRDVQIEGLKRVVNDMRHSTSWKSTTPLRFLGHLVRGDYKIARNVLKNRLIQVTSRIPLLRFLHQFIISIRILLIHRKSGLFDPEWYLENNPDVKAATQRPFLHFVLHGVFEGRAPCALFDSGKYLQANPDVGRTGMEAVLHFMLHGFRENRISNSLDRYIYINYGPEVLKKISGLLALLVYGQGSELSKKEYRSKLKALATRLQSALTQSPPEPTVSVIIPVYNQVFHTLACLISLFESAPETAFEVIIADDCSTDETATILAKFSDRIRIVRTPGNLGFLKNCNHAAKEAKGEFVVFLNNDMVLLPEWLDSLVATISKDRECGMVGSKLLNLDGTLQEAGGIFWNDGSAWNYGRGQNPMAPEFNYKKEVDYCSGASICLRKEVWDAVGGFDELYAPAYCEESDLAFRLRARGLKTIYQPRSVGIHLEGVSCGTDTAHGIKAYQVENLKKLQGRWFDVLEKEHFPNAEQVFLARDRSAKKRHMLFVDHYLPRPDFDAGSKQMATYLQVFVEMGFQISFWPDNLGYDKEYARPLEELGIEVISCTGGAITFEEWIKKNGQHLDVAFLVRPYVALKYIQWLKENSNASIVYYGVDIHFIRTKGELNLNPTDQALLTRVANEEEAETECWKKADLILYPSFEECQYIGERFASAKIDLLPLYCKSIEEILAAKTTADFYKRSGILFVGGFDHAPNKDGILWFCNEILPLIRKISPDVCLTIAGSNPPEEVRRLESDLIKVTGRVSDSKLSEFYNQHRVAVAPLRFGAGVKGKVVESLLKGLPIVTTSIGSQGLCNSVKAISIARSEQDFCEKVTALLQIENKWIAQRKSGIKYFEDNFSLQKIKPNLTKLLQNTKVNTCVF
jgi:GT2 family glycosyltransferase/glycosyltransferase involved in cell wall biosynthesis